MMKNPFTLQVALGEAFGNRTSEKSQLNRLINENKSIWLAAPKRTGKTSLVKEVLTQLERERKAVCIYFDLYFASSPEELFGYLIKSCMEQFYEKISFYTRIKKKTLDFMSSIIPTMSIDQQGSIAFSLAPNLSRGEGEIDRFFLTLNYISKYFKRKVIIAFDEFQAIDRADKFLSDQFAVRLKNNRNALYIFLGSEKYMMDLIMSRSNFDFAVTSSLSDINNNGFQEFFSNKFKATGVEINGEVIKEVLNLTNPCLYFTQVIFSYIWDQKRDNPSMDDSHIVLHSIESLLRNYNSMYRSYFELISSKEQKTLKGIALSSDECNYKKMYINSLCKKEFVYISKEDKVEFSDIFFKLWIIDKFGNLESHLNSGKY